MKNARELMTADPETVTPEDSIADAARVMRALNVGFIPVVEDEAPRRLTGVITDRDIAVRHVAEDHEPGCRVKDHMSSDDLAVVNEDTPADEVLRLMKENRVRRIPVVDRERNLVGVIAQADVAREIGPTDPDAVEDVVEEISEPTAVR